MTSTTIGKVYLIGAGPGDPGLITVRGMDCLRQADVVIYDYLANPALLEEAPVTAEKVYVGKTKGYHCRPQDEINALLTEYARKGLTVVRLKGGDPHVFGRVLSHCGSFVDIRGGHRYPELVRSSHRKPIRVFLQSGANDMNNFMGNWPRANQKMAEALEAAGYESRFEFGAGGHSLRHGGALFAESIRWLAA